MKLYEINLQLQQLLDELVFDPETGEIGEDMGTVLAQIDALQLQRMDVLEYLAKCVLNYRSDAAALKAEEQRLKERRQRIERKEDRLLQILDRECAGEKTDLGVATLNYRKTTRVDVQDAKAAIRWLTENGHPDCCRIPDPEVSTSDVGRLLKAGMEIPGVQRINSLSCSLK